MDNTRIKQKNNDYFIRLGECGENRYDIEKRLNKFLKELYNDNLKDNTIVVVSHGSIISYIKRILGLQSVHVETGQMELFENVDFKNLFLHEKKLNKIKKETNYELIKIINDLRINSELKKNLFKIIKKEFNNKDFSKEIIKNYLEGLNTNKLEIVTDNIFDDSIILICFYNNFENLAKKWIEHYINIGIKNFVLIDNNSSDKSTKILKKYGNQVNISFWKINDKYNCNTMCGWKQKIFEYYGKNKYYLTVDSDEFLIYKDYDKVDLSSFILKNKIKSMKAMILDVYSKKRIYCGKLNEYMYIDKGTYYASNINNQYQRFYGGPRYRIFGIKPSLQKIPLLFYTGKEIFINDHFYYPWEINNKSEFCSYLLHYKFLPGDFDKYIDYARDKRHCNNSREYKIYCKEFKKNNEISFFDKDISISINEIEYEFR